MSFILTLLYITVFYERCSALYNVTVDDSGFDPLTGAAIHYGVDWDYGPTCTKCLAQPEAGEAYNDTWHDASYLSTSSSDNNIPQTMTFQFTGALAYCVRVYANTH